MTRHSDAIIRRCIRVLTMVSELHKQGFQRLRIVPGMSGSGMHWRCTVTPITNILRSHGAMYSDMDYQCAHYTSAMGNRYFDWANCESATARKLAAHFSQRFPRILELGRGRDWIYAGWYSEMLGFAENGDLPVAYADWYSQPDHRWLPTMRTFESGLPMPPPGEAEPMHAGS